MICLSEEENIDLIREETRCDLFTLLSVELGKIQFAELVKHRFLSGTRAIFYGNM